MGKKLKSHRMGNRPRVYATIAFSMHSRQSRRLILSSSPLSYYNWVCKYDQQSLQNIDANINAFLRSKSTSKQPSNTFETPNQIHLLREKLLQYRLFLDSPGVQGFG